MAGKKKPLLDLLVSQFPHYSRDELYRFILCGNVVAEDGIYRDAKTLFDIKTTFSISMKKYVSRGGFKLEKALTAWNIDSNGKVVLDAGASTGGFTDCLLQQGASRVYAVDVGYNQLAFQLRKNPNVCCMEKTNIMCLQELEPQPDFAVCDLSFRSVIGAASRICSITKEKRLIALIKPQFEYKREFDGVLTDTGEITETLIHVTEQLVNEGCSVNAMLESPITGAKGNREFLFHIKADSETYDIGELKQKIKQLVDR